MCFGRGEKWIDGEGGKALRTQNSTQTGEEKDRRWFD